MAEVAAPTRPEQPARSRAWLRGDDRALAAIVGAGVAVRVVWCIYAARSPVGLHDPGLYRFLGEQVASGEGYRLPDGSPTAYYPIGYPMVLAVGFLLTPFAWQTGVVAVANVLCQAVTIVLVHRITRRILDGRRIPALLAAALVAAWPNLVLHTAVPLSESLFIALALGATAVAVAGPWPAGGFDTRRLVIVGLLLGAATLVRPVSVPILVALFVAWVVAGFGWRRALGHTAVVAGVVVLVLVPWVIRNAIVMDAPVVSTNTGDNLCMSRRVGGSGGFEFPNFRCNSGPFDDLPRPAYEIERDEQGRRLAFEFVRDHPVEELKLVVKRAGHTFESDDDAIAAVESYGEDRFLTDGLRSALRVLSNVWYVVVGLAGLVGLGVLAARWRGDGLFVVLTAVALTSAPLLSFGDVRFKVPVLPYLAIGAAVLFDVVVRRRRASPPSP